MTRKRMRRRMMLKRGKLLRIKNGRGLYAPFIFC